MATRIPADVIRYARHRRAYIPGSTFTGKDVSDGAFDDIVRDVLAMDSPDEELALIAKDVDELGYLSLGHIAAVANWIANQSPAIPNANPRARCLRCRRELADPESIATGYGPECRKAVA